MTDVPAAAPPPANPPVVGPPLRVLVVDDEPLARRGVRARLVAAEAAGAVTVVAEAADGHEAVDLLLRLTPDVVFLDVRMSGLDGFAVLDAVRATVGPGAMPVVVFLTAYDQYALRAFEAQALDYLLKPIDEQRFAEALARAGARVAERRAGALGRRVAAALADTGTGGVADTAWNGLPPGAGPAPVSRATEMQAPRPIASFLVRRGGRTLVVRAADVDWIAADGDYVRLHVGRDAHLVRETMTRVEARLDPARFARVHRSAIVNVERVRELLPYSNREAILVLAGGTRLKVSRGYRDRLAALLTGAT